MNSITTENYDAGAMRSRLIILLGIFAAIIGAAGGLGISPMLAYLIPKLMSGEYFYLFNLVLFQVMWAVFFVSVLVGGIKVSISGLQRRGDEISPGLRL